MRRIVSALIVLVGSVLPAAGGPAVPLIEGPDVPSTSPADEVVRVFDGERYDGCAGKVAATRSVAVPSGTWDRIMLVLTAVPDGDPWDRRFSVSIGGVEVLRGTTPRTAFTIRRDITEYATLLDAGGVTDVMLSLETYVGEQVGTLDLEFYADEPTAALVRQPWDRITGVFNTGRLEGNLKRLSSLVEFPDSPPASATVELTLSNHGAEEAQFHNRLFRVLVDGKELAFTRALPYTYAILGFGAANANMACSGKATDAVGDALHPLMWWTAQQVLDVLGVHLGVGEIPPFRAQVDAADLALLAGVRTVEVLQIGGGAYWITSLSLLMNG